MDNKEVMFVGFDIYNFVKDLCEQFPLDNPDMTDGEKKAYKLGIDNTLGLLKQILNEWIKDEDDIYQNIAVNIPNLNTMSEFVTNKELNEYVNEYVNEQNKFLEKTKNTEKRFYIPWNELCWDGITVKGGYKVTGQLLKRDIDEYYICTATYPMYREGERLAPMIGRWHKVIPSTLKRTKITLLADDVDEEEYDRKLLSKPIPEQNINLDDIEFDGWFTMDESDLSE